MVLQKEEFLYYIISYHFKETTQYALWGYGEKEGVIDQNCLALNENYEVIFGKTKEELITILSTYQYDEFDSERLNNWLETQAKASEVITFDIDKAVQFLQQFIFPKDQQTFNQFDNLWGTLSVVDDYLQMVNDEELNEKFEYFDYMKLHNELMNVMIWKTDDETKLKSYDVVCKVITSSNFLEKYQQLFSVFLRK